MESSIIHIVLEQCRNIDLVYKAYVTPDFREKPVRGILASHQTQNPPIPISIGNERAVCAPGERTFYRVKVPKSPGSGKT